MQHRRRILGVELRTDVPALLRNLHDLHQVGGRINTHALHTLGLVLLLIFVVELIAVTVALANQCLVAIGLVDLAALHQLTLIGTQTHGTAHLRNRFLLFHDVDDVVRRLVVHLRTVSILVAQHVARKLNDHHLHTQTDAEGGNIVRTGVFRGDNLAFDTTLTEARTNQHALHALQFLCDILLCHLLAVDEVDLCFYIIIYTSQVQTLTDTLIRILQVVLANQSDVHLLRGIALLVEEVVPGLHRRCLAHGDANLTQDGGIQSLMLHAHGHLIDRGHILTLHHALQVHVTERCHLHPHAVVQMTLCAQHQNIGLNAHTLQLLHRVLRGFGLQLVSSLQIRYVGQVHTHGVSAQLPAQLSDGLHEGRTLNIADGAAHLSDNEVKLFILLVLSQHPALNLIRDMRHHLNGLAQIVATTLAVNHRLVDTTGSDRVMTRGMNTCEALVVPQVQVGLHTVGRHIAFAMLIGVQRTWVDVDVGVKLLDSYFIAACLQQFSN